MFKLAKLAQNPFSVALTAAAMVAAYPALGDSYSPANSHVTQVASSQLYKQNAVIFKLDQGNSDCAADSYIYYYSSNADDLKAQYATVMSAYLANAPLIVHFPTPGSCVADNLGLGTY